MSSIARLPCEETCFRRCRRLKVTKERVRVASVPFPAAAADRLGIATCCSVRPERAPSPSPSPSSAGRDIRRAERSGGVHQVRVRGRPARVQYDGATAINAVGCIGPCRCTHLSERAAKQPSSAASLIHSPPGVFLDRKGYGRTSVVWWLLAWSVTTRSTRSFLPCPA